MLSGKKICVIGTGNMGMALIEGLISTKAANPEDIVCTDIRQDKLDSIKQEHGVNVSNDNLQSVQDSDIIIYAIKPQIMAAVLKETAPVLDMSKLVISIAAGVPLAAIESRLNKKLRLIRVMPNIAVAVKEGASAIAAGKHASKEDIQQAKAIFDSVGESLFIEENILMDAITGLSGSGPAYIFTIVDAMADAGVKMGLSREDAQFLSTQTVLGAALLLKKTEKHPGELKNQVTSPGGTAIAGLHTLEKGGLRTTMMDAVEAATLRSRELGELTIQNFNNKNHN